MIKKLLSILFLVLFFGSQIQAQEPYKIYLPMVIKMGTLDNQFRIIQQVASSNYVLNPSAETTGNFSAVSGATVTRVTTYAKYGLYSYEVVAGVAGRGVQLTLSALTNAEHFATVRVRGNTHLQATVGSATKPLKFIEKIDEYWLLYGVAFSKTQANGQTALQITAIQPGTFYIDGVQVEPLPYWTTFIDGGQDGCAWRGAAHASISERSGQSKAGGRSYDFYEQYGFFIEKVVGGGAAPRELGVDNYAILPGGELNSDKVQPREWTIIGRFVAASEPELHDKKEALESAFYAGDSQLTRIRFNGGKVQKEIGARYTGGLEGDLPAFYGDFSPDGETWVRNTYFTEKVAIQLVSPDPYWYEVGESAIALDVNDSATFESVAARFRSTGQWSNLGPPDAAGTYSTGINAIAEDATYVYFGGDFSNFNNIASADNVVRYNKSTGAWSALDVGLNDIVYGMALAPNGDLYIVGQFLNAGGVENADYITRWDGANFNAVGVPNAGAASITFPACVVFDRTGKLFIGGNFQNWADIANADYLVQWDGSNYSAVVAGLNNTVWALAVGLDNKIYIGGEFTAPATTYIAYWDGTSLTDIGSTFDDAVKSIKVNVTGNVFATGDFTVPFPYVAQWNGTQWAGLGSGLGGPGRAVSIGPDNIVYISGSFVSAGDLSVYAMVRWNGAVFSKLDVDLPGTPNALFYASQIADPVVSQQYDLFVGYNTDGTGYYAGKVSPTNEGSVPAYPQIIYQRSGGVSATITTLKNERTGKELLLNYALLNGESLLIDLDPQSQSVISSFFGSRPDAILANSDLGTWTLEPGSQVVTSFVDEVGGPTVTAWMLWKERCSSY